MVALKEVTIYTDGSCPDNPGAGGYGAIILHEHFRKELSGGFQATTNNRMELLAAIIALESLKKPCKVSVFSDSQYVVNGMAKGRALGWRSRGWKISTNKSAHNIDLWERLLSLCQTHETSFYWVPGHKGIEENERADQLAAQGSHQNNLQIDDGYIIRLQ